MAHIPSDKNEKLPFLGRFLSWFTLPQNSKFIIGALVIVCIGLFLADFTYKKYGHFEVETYKESAPEMEAFHFCQREYGPSQSPHGVAISGIRKS